MMILNVFNHLRDSLPQIRQIFIDHWFPLESFEKRLECFFRYDKIHQIIIHRLAHERLIHTLMNEKYLLVKKQLELKTKENDQLQLQLSRLQSTNTKNTLIQNNKSQINEMQTAIQSTTAPQTKIKPLSFSFSSMYNNNQSGKSLLPQQQSSSFSTKRLSPIQSVDEITTVEHPVYINMSSRIRSEHPIIEHCLRRIELLRPRIMHYKSEHKFRVYKELDHEISILMNELNGIDCSKDDTIFAQDKNVALCELHNLAGVLERSIECHDNDCVICNSFMYKPEVSV